MHTLHLIAIGGLIAAPTALQAQKELSQDEIASHLMTWVAPVSPQAPSQLIVVGRNK
jgi:hypothetical protein